MPSTTIYLKDYKPASFKMDCVELFFDLYEDHALVKSKMKLIRQHPGPLHLYGEALELISIQLDGHALDPKSIKTSEADLILESCPDEFLLEIETRIKPQENTELSGLYRSDDLFCTQCEAEGFRRITYFLDRPDVLTQYTTYISADKKKYPVLLSNGNLIGAGDLEKGRHWVLWQDPFKKPSYLFALVAGQLTHIEDTFITCSGRRIALQIYVEPGNENKCAFAMESLKKAMKWDEEVYGREYDLDIFMIVAVRNFNMGAMENKGLNIFNSKYILANVDTATDQDFFDVEGVVGHEYFHNWTGNRVTCRDWFQLSLKEGLTVFRDQEFSRDMNSRDLFRINDVNVLRASQFPEDAGLMAHPVRPSSFQEINNFYTATIYNKGAEVIRMQHTLLGKEGFRKGMDLYFQRHDGEAVTIEDFVASMEQANGIDLTQFKLWYSQAGTPEVQVKSSYSEGCLILNLEQSCPLTPDGEEKKPFHIPIAFAFFDSLGNRIAVDKELLELKEASQRFVFSNLKERPVVSILREFSAPIRIKDELEFKDLLLLFRFETDGYAKWEAGKRLVLNTLVSFIDKPASEWQLPKELISAIKHVLLDETLDCNMRAKLMVPPGFEDVAGQMELIDPELIEALRDFYMEHLGQALYAEASFIYNQLWHEEENSPNRLAYGPRALRNFCLSLMMKADEAATLNLCRHQFTDAKTMTDKVASFALLVNCSDALARNEAIEGFYKKWQNEDLVIEKWFALQASCELPGTLAQVKELLEHPAFSMTNPNKVRALIGAFCMANPRHFHALDGSGYEFLTQMLIQLDPLNPQIASRLATPLTRWQCFDKPRQLLMKKQLEDLSAVRLSPDLSELVSKSLKV